MRRRNDTRGAESSRPAAALVSWGARLLSWVFYRVERTGPSLPDGAVLLVANHPNGLLDPALVWSTAGRPIRFLAKSTLFAIPVVGALFRASGAIPVYRRTDQGADTSRNAEMFDAVDRALRDDAVVCLFPEGISHSTGRLEPLRTGAARIALAAAHDGQALAIVPVGLNFDRKAVFRSPAIVAYGAAFGCADLIAPDEADARAAADQLTVRIADHLRLLIVEAEPVSDAAVVARVESLYREARGLSAAAPARMERQRLIASGLDRLRAAAPVEYEHIREMLRTYDARLARFGLRDRDLDTPPGAAAAARFAARELLLAVLLVPIALAGLVVFAAPYAAVDLLARRTRYLEERATWKATLGVIVYGLWGLLLAGAAAARWTVATGGGVLAGLPLLAAATMMSVERETAVFHTARAYVAARRVPSRVRTELAAGRSNIADVLERAHRWIGAQP